jgi:hypothetical protein
VTTDPRSRSSVMIDGANNAKLVGSASERA